MAATPTVMAALSTFCCGGGVWWGGVAGGGLFSRFRSRLAAQPGPVLGGLFDDAGGLSSEQRHALFCPEHVELAIGDHPGFRIGLVFFSTRDIDCTIPVELRRVMIRIGNEESTM